MRKRRIRPRLLWLLAGMAGVIALSQVIGPVIRNWRVEQAISRFEAGPSQARADALFDLLESHAADDEQGRRALSLLLRPDIVMRESYPAGQIVMVSVEQPFAPDSDKILWEEETISINGLPGIPRRSSRGPVERRPHLATVGVYEQPGIYPAEIHIRCALGIERAGRMTAIAERLRLALYRFVRLPTGWTRARTYECDFTATTRITVVAQDKAERIELTSSPELDQAMRAAFSPERRQSVRQYSTASGNRWIRGPWQITYKDLPAAAAFNITLRLSDGSEIGRAVARPARAGDSGVFMIPLWDIKLEQPGRYDATLVLTPVLDWAYRDPAIKALWNGTLEFPISFHIDANAPRGWNARP